MQGSRLVLLCLLPLAACSHSQKPAPPPAVSSAAAGWKVAAERRHEGFLAAPIVEIRDFAEAPTQGFQPWPLDEADRRRFRTEEPHWLLSEKPLLDSGLVQGASMGRGFVERSSSLGTDLEVVLEWTSEGRRRLKELSAARVGRKVALLVKGRILSVAIIQSVIDSPQIHLLVEVPLTEVAVWLRELNPTVDLDARACLLQACDRGEAAACAMTAAESLLGRDLPLDEVLADRSDARACDLGQSDSCLRGATRRLADSSLRHPEVLARPLLGRGCDLANWACCHRLAKGLLEERSRASAATLAEAQSLLTKACEGRWAAACADLAELTFKQEGVAARGRGGALLERACDYGDAEACRQRGELALDLSSTDVDTAARWYRKACSLDRRAMPPAMKCDANEDWNRRLALKRAAGCEVSVIPCPRRVPDPPVGTTDR